VKFSSVVSIQIFSIKNENPYFYAKCIENGYFPLPSKFENNGYFCWSVKMQTPISLDGSMQ
jgi:hypothetical protein